MPGRTFIKYRKIQESKEEEKSLRDKLHSVVPYYKKFTRYLLTSYNVPSLVLNTQTVPQGGRKQLCIVSLLRPERMMAATPWVQDAACKIYSKTLSYVTHEITMCAMFWQLR